MHILVTGGAGFIGSHTAVALHAAGYTPLLLDDFSNSNESVLKGLETILNEKVTCIQGNCGDLELLRDVFKTYTVGGVIHFAAFKAVGESMEKPLQYYENNIGNLLVLLRAMQEYGVRNIIFSSSCTVYGEPDALPVTEETPVKPATSVYGNTKQVGEEILRDVARASGQLRVCALRYFNPVGAHPSGLIGELPLGVPNNLVPFITQTAAGLRPELVVFGDDYPTKDGSCVRDFIHVMDLAEAHVAALETLGQRSGYSFEVYNIGTGEGSSVLEMIALFEKVNGIKVPFRIGARRPGDVVAVYADASLAVRTLGWKAQRGMEEALRDAWNWQLYLQAAAQV